MKKYKILVVGLLLSSIAGVARADCQPADSQGCRNMREADRTYKDMKAAEERERMRDKSHDNRYKVDDNTSLGVDQNGPNVKKTFK